MSDDALLADTTCSAVLNVLSVSVIPWLMPAPPYTRAG